MKSRDQKIDELIAKDEIYELIIRYSRGCDRADEDELRSVFHDDAELDYGNFTGGPAEFASWATGVHLEHFVGTSHFMLNSLIKVSQSQESATGETYNLVWMRTASGQWFQGPRHHRTLRRPLREA